MKIAVLGTGMVGKTIASKLVSLGHEVRMGSRTPDNEGAQAWKSEAGDQASTGTFADAAAFGEVVFNCVNGVNAVAALEAAGAGNLEGKILLDVSNPLDFSEGMPPVLAIQGRDSLGETIQRTFPKARVVKTLNTMSCDVMVDPSRVPGEHDVFLSGDDAEAKAAVSGYLVEWFGWKAPIDLGDISTSRGVEAWLPMWLRLWGALGTGDFNLKVVKA